MNSLLMKQEIDKNITKTQFLEDLNCLFTNLKELSFVKDGHFYIREAVESAPIHGTINK